DAGILPQHLRGAAADHAVHHAGRRRGDLPRRPDPNHGAFGRADRPDDRGRPAAPAPFRNSRVGPLPGARGPGPQAARRRTRRDSDQQGRAFHMIDNLRSTGGLARRAGRAAGIAAVAAVLFGAMPAMSAEPVSITYGYHPYWTGGWNGVVIKVKELWKKHL